MHRQPVMKGGFGASRYNPDVAKPLAIDTSPEVERRQIEGWRRMSAAEKRPLSRG